MNQTQRKFLLDKIDKQLDIRVRALRDAQPEQPNLANFLLAGILAGTLEIRSSKELKHILRERALQDVGEWLDTSYGTHKTEVKFKLREFFVIPPEAETANQAYIQEYNRLETEIHELVIRGEGLKTRIQLASDKTLQKMIDEVDDMGDISLMDNTLKQLSASTTPKLLGL